MKKIFKRNDLSFFNLILKELRKIIVGGGMLPR